MTKALIFAFVASAIAITYSLIVAYKIGKKDAGNEKVKEITLAIYKGAMTFLNKEYKVLIIFVVVIAVLLGIGMGGWKVSLAFITGSIFSALAGNIGMRIATKANARTAVACQKGINPGLKIAFSSGSVMGLGVVGFGLLGITLMFLMANGLNIGPEINSNIMYAFGFGASLIALFQLQLPTLMALHCTLAI